MKPSEKMKQYNEKNAHYSQENTMKIEKNTFSWECKITPPSLNVTWMKTNFILY